MENLQRKRELIRDRLFNLQNVSFKKPSAMELHNQKGHLLRRVQRMEERRYRQRVMLQQKQLKGNLNKINNYFKKVNSKSISAEQIPKPIISPLSPTPIKVQTRLSRLSRLQRGRNN